MSLPGEAAALACFMIERIGYGFRAWPSAAPE